MTGRVNDLAEFLLARIAEDATAAGEPDPTEPDEWKIEASDYDWPSVSPARVLAECEAKRRIVAMWQENRAVGWRDAETRSQQEALHVVLCALALPYADHPDFRDEWRP